MNIIWKKMEKEINFAKSLIPNSDHSEFIGKIDVLTPEEGLRRLNK